MADPHNSIAGAPVSDAPQGGAPLSGSSERRREQARTWRTRSERVRRWRRLLPFGIGAALVLLVAWVAGRGLISRLTAPKADDNAVVKMVNPRFYGRDLQNRAFVVAARSAERPRNNTQAITLRGPALTMDAEGPNPTSVKAARGVYHERTRKVTLDGGVVVSNQQGYRFRTERAFVDTQKGIVAGDRGVVGTGPIGTVAASSYAVTDRGQRIVFKGGVRARIEQ